MYTLQWYASVLVMTSSEGFILMCMYFVAVLALYMECVSDEGSSTLERATVISDRDQMNAKRFCADDSNETPSAATSTPTDAARCSVNNIYMESAGCRDILSDSAGTLTDCAVSNVNGRSQPTPVDRCSPADVECRSSDADVSRRRHPRRKLTTNSRRSTPI